MVDPLIGPTMAETIAAANAAVADAVPEAEADPYRPRFHFRPPARWMNDICAALWWRDWYHIFYQFNPTTNIATWKREPTCWGHARSRDLVRWEHLPIALAPSLEDGDWACHSGSATLDGSGRPMLFFTYNGIGKPAREQWAARPLDDELIRWQKTDVGLAPGKSGIPADLKPTWADPFVFHCDSKSFVTFKSCAGMVCQALNEELTQWRYAGRVDAISGECPNFFALQDRWVLLRSTYPMTYQVGEFDATRVRFSPTGPGGVLDHAYGPAKPSDFTVSRGFYGSNVMFDSRQRCVLVGWAGAFKPRGWNCCMSLPRHLTLAPDGRARQSPVPELACLRGRHAKAGPQTLHNAVAPISGIAPDSFEALIELPAGPRSASGLRWQGLEIRAEGSSLNVAGTTVPVVDGRLRLHVFFDRCLLEVFLDEGETVVTRVCYPAQPGVGMELFAEGEPATVGPAEVWEVSAIWER